VQKHAGGQLVPPGSVERFAELPAWSARDVAVEGTDWLKSTVDIHIAGLGWVAVGVKGEAKFRVWVAPTVQVTTRPALIPDYAKEFERPGFSCVLPKAAAVAAAVATAAAPAGGRGGRGGGRGSGRGGSGRGGSGRGR
jgi:hypothetical protein